MCHQTAMPQAPLKCSNENSRIRSLGNFLAVFFSKLLSKKIVRGSVAITSTKELDLCGDVDEIITGMLL